MEKESIGLVVLFVAVIVGFTAVATMYDFGGEDLENANGDQIDDNAVKIDMPDQVPFESFHLTVSSEDNGQVIEQSFWARETAEGYVDFRQETGLLDNESSESQIINGLVYNSQQGIMYMASRQTMGMWQETTVGEFENLLNSGPTGEEIGAGEYFEILMNQNYSLAQGKEVGDIVDLRENVQGEIKALKIDEEIEDNVFEPVENGGGQQVPINMN